MSTLPALELNCVILEKRNRFPFTIQRGNAARVSDTYDKKRLFQYIQTPPFNKAASSPGARSPMVSTATQITEPFSISAPESIIPRD